MRRTASGRRLSLGEDDDLAVLGGLFEHLGQALDARRVHGLHGVVDDDETKRAFGKRGARDEETEGESVELTDGSVLRAVGLLGAGSRGSGVARQLKPMLV